MESRFYLYKLGHIQEAVSHTQRTSVQGHIPSGQSHVNGGLATLTTINKQFLQM